MVVELIGKERVDLSDTGHGEGHIPDPRKEEGGRRKVQDEDVNDSNKERTFQLA